VLDSNLPTVSTARHGHNGAPPPLSALAHPMATMATLELKDPGLRVTVDVEDDDAVTQQVGAHA
jgi:hypothetical protein